MQNQSNLNTIPTSWIWTKVGCICTHPQYGYTTKAKQTGQIKLLRTTDITSGSINWETVPYCTDNPEDIEKYLLHEGDILISRAGSIGVSYLLKEVDYSVFASYLIRFKPFINKKFFKFFLNSPLYWNQVFENKLGIAVTNINATKLKEINFPLAPLPEQERIVNRIEELFSELDAGVESLKTAQAQLKRYRQSVLKSAFEGKLTAEWREQKQEEGKLESAEQLLQKIEEERQNRYQKELEAWEKEVQLWEENGKLGKKPKKPQKLKELSPLTEAELAKIPELLNAPSCWIQINLKEVCSAVDPQPSHRTPPKVEKGIPYVSFQNINKDTGEIYFEQARQVSPKVLEEHISRYSIEEGDFIIGKIGTIGKPFSIPKKRFYALSANVILVKPYQDIIDSQFVFYLIKSNLIEKQFKLGSRATAQSAFGITKVRLLTLPFPSLREQQEIVKEIESRFSICDQLEATITENLQKSEALRQSILKQAFSGKLVPQDPNDEPASVLLERIKQEKENAQNPTQTSLNV